MKCFLTISLLATSFMYCTESIVGADHETLTVLLCDSQSSEQKLSSRKEAQVLDPNLVQVVDSKLLVDNVIDISDQIPKESFHRQIYKGTVVQKGVETQNITVGDEIAFYSDFDINVVLNSQSMVVNWEMVLFKYK